MTSLRGSGERPHLRVVQGGRAVQDRPPPASRAPGPLRRAWAVLVAALAFLATTVVLLGISLAYRLWG